MYMYIHIYIYVSTHSHTHTSSHSEAAPFKNKPNWSGWTCDKKKSAKPAPCCQICRQIEHELCLSLTTMA